MLTGWDPLEPRSAVRVAAAQAYESFFPCRVHYMLQDMENDGLGHIASFQPHGRAFRVHDIKRFENEILPKWFQQTRYTSFVRQLNHYEFTRITHGPDKGAYFHKFFVKGQRHLCDQIKRVKIKGKGPRRPAEPDGEPNFYLMPASVERPDATSFAGPVTTIPSFVGAAKDAFMIGFGVYMPTTSVSTQSNDLASAMIMSFSQPLGLTNGEIDRGFVVGIQRSAGPCTAGADARQLQQLLESHAPPPIKASWCHPTAVSSAIHERNVQPMPMFDPRILPFPEGSNRGSNLT